VFSVLKLEWRRMHKLRTTFMAELLSGFQITFSTSEFCTLVLIRELNWANTKWKERVMPLVGVKFIPLQSDASSKINAANRNEVFARIRTWPLKTNVTALLFNQVLNFSNRVVKAMSLEQISFARNTRATEVFSTYISMQKN
jgi:hypothetical protein